MKPAGLLQSVCLITWLTYTNQVSLPQAAVVYPCKYNYEPVCGSDSVTYMNKDVLESVSCSYEERGLTPIEVVEDCECSDFCVCQKVDLPVCTTCGITYPNECELACENRRREQCGEPALCLAYRTACSGPPGNCSDEDCPVCGTDNVIYRNRCTLDYVSCNNQQRGLPAVDVCEDESCADKYLCPLTSQPVCASDGNVYNNPCELAYENYKRRCSGLEELVEANDVVCNGCCCDGTYEPVCATDGNTYSNLCQLDCECQRQNNPELRPLYTGECGVCQCDDEDDDPVCGTDGNTYGSCCLLECQNLGKCEDDKIAVAYEGQCRNPCDCSYCDDSYQPMCGSDGQTYDSLCSLKCNDRCCQKNGGAPIYLARRGIC